MTLHLHHLRGCAPVPLAFYLKALGVLRIVAEQKDPTVRGWWQDEHFCLLTKLDRGELEEFFLEEYAPTPFVSPWNKGSGLVKQNDPALSRLENSTAVRFASFRAGIFAARADLDALSQADALVRALKDRTKAKKGMSSAAKQAARALRGDPEFKRELAEADRRFKSLKAELFQPLLRSWRGAHRLWLDSALVWIDDEQRPAWPSLLGTGGNDGNLDFTNNAMQRLGELFDLASPDGRASADARELLVNCFWEVPSNRLAAGAAVGQFHPGGAGGANSTNGVEGDSIVNAWDFVLAMEGAMLFSARSTRRLDPNATNRASAPFAVRGHPVAYGSHGQDKTDRGEQWMPLWDRPACVPDLQVMLGEGRMQLGRQIAHRPVDVARAVSRLGITRGIIGFARFGYLERNGQSRIAVPLGRIDVRARPRTHLLDELAPWLDRLQRHARDEHAPHRLVAAEGTLADAVFAVLTHDDSPDRWQSVLLAASATEAVQASGTAFEAGPIPALSPEWLDAADDGSVEWRLACALGSAAGSYERTTRPRDPVRHHWLPLQDGARRLKLSERRLAQDPRVVMSGRDPIADCLALVQRRLVEALGKAERHLPLVTARGCDAHPSDIAELIGGRIELDRVMALGRALMAVRWDRVQNDGGSRRQKSLAWPDEAWIALRLACLAWPLDENRKIPAESGIVRRLEAGDGAAAVDIALRRLRAAGMRPPLQGACSDHATARLWGAALAFPISHRSACEMAKRFESSNQEDVR
jgi:CRISPR-associated protein Csx17